MFDFIPILKNTFDLNEKDIEIYLDLLKHGHTAVSTIAARTHIDRTTAYSAIKRLISKGLIVRTAKKGTAYFTALDPEVFEDKVEHQIEQKEALLRAIKRYTPQMRMMKNKQAEGRPRIQIFEGPEGIISLYEQLLQTSKAQDVFLTVEKMPKDLKRYLTKEFMKHKLKAGVKSRVVVEDSKRAKAYKALDKGANRETKLIPRGTNPFETEIIIGDDNEVAIIDFQDELIGVHIRSRSIRNTMSRIFEMTWGA